MWPCWIFIEKNTSFDLPCILKPSVPNLKKKKSKTETFRFCFASILTTESSRVFTWSSNVCCLTLILQHSAAKTWSEIKLDCCVFWTLGLSTYISTKWDLDLQATSVWLYFLHMPNSWMVTCGFENLWTISTNIELVKKKNHWTRFQLLMSCRFNVTCGILDIISYFLNHHTKSLITYSLSSELLSVISGSREQDPEWPLYIYVWVTRVLSRWLWRKCPYSLSLSSYNKRFCPISSSRSFHCSFTTFVLSLSDG